MSKIQIFVLFWIAAPGLVGVIGYLFKRRYGLAAALAILLAVVVYLAIQ
jgi:hypothetical protein